MAAPHRSGHSVHLQSVFLTLEPMWQPEVEEESTERSGAAHQRPRRSV